MVGREDKDIRDSTVGQTHDATGQARPLLQGHLGMFGGQAQL